MSTITTIGLVLWGICFLGAIGLIPINIGILGWVPQSRWTRLIVMPIGLLFAIIVFTFIGLIGLALLAPLQHFFGIGTKWFIATTF